LITRDEVYCDIQVQGTVEGEETCFAL
jgi:hypothetical protein